MSRWHVSRHFMEWSMVTKKLAPDLIRRGYLFSRTTVLQRWQERDDDCSIPIVRKRGCRRV